MTVAYQLFDLRLLEVQPQSRYLYELLETLRFLPCNLLLCRVVENDANCITKP